ncbi:MAG TPA: antibiotic biosynthesis monooxygenase [Vicinamibacterales bacterium]|nr:antibiotic biosynthesis monooxygenase [Vicinamibacterales bacterium]
MLIILFRSKLTTAAGDDYAAMADAMLDRARAFEGFVDVKSFTAEDGERLSVVWWRDQASLTAWAADARHQGAKALGRQKWFEYYKMDVAEIVRVSEFQRTS